MWPHVFLRASGFPLRHFEDPQIIALLTWLLLNIFIFSLFAYCLFFFFLNQIEVPWNTGMSSSVS